MMDKVLEEEDVGACDDDEEYVEYEDHESN